MTRNIRDEDGDLVSITATEASAAASGWSIRLGSGETGYLMLDWDPKAQAYRIVSRIGVAPEVKKL